MSKTEITLEVDSHLLEQARAAQIDMAAAFERRLASELGDIAADERARKWAADNAEAIKDHNERIAQRGVFGEDLRRW